MNISVLYDCIGHGMFGNCFTGSITRQHSGGCSRNSSYYQPVGEMKAKHCSTTENNFVLFNSQATLRYALTYIES